MSDTVVGIRGEVVADTEARTAFVRFAAEAFDQYVADHGEEPEALVVVWCGVRQVARSGWLIRGESEESGTAVIALANAALVSALCNSDLIRRQLTSQE